MDPGRPERSRAGSPHGEPRTEPPSEAAEPIPASGRQRAVAGRERSAEEAARGHLAPGEEPIQRIGTIWAGTLLSRIPEMNQECPR